MEDIEQNVVELWRFGMSFSGSQFMERSGVLIFPNKVTASRPWF